MTRAGLLHPGEMGSSLGQALARGDTEVFWASEHRSKATHGRAESAGLTDAGSLELLASRCDILLTVCPPHAALEVATSVAACGFSGTYVDANAVAPTTVESVESVVRRAGASFVDGGIIGPPARVSGTTRLYLSGDGATEIAALFEGSVLEAIALSGGAGAASALKMCFAAYTKGSAALLIAIRALAAARKVEGDLLAEWAKSLPDLAARSEAHARGSAKKAWRFAGEMEEIAATFAAERLPGGFHLAAAEIFRALERFKDSPESPDLAEVLGALLERRN